MHALAADEAPCDLGDSLARVFGAAAHQAAGGCGKGRRRTTALHRHGRPGTGKTTLAASLIALLADLGIAQAHRIGLVTPTGKAAARLQEAVKTRLDESDLRAKVPALADFLPAACTIHRLLARSDLRVDALVVDECSMVDLPLMNRLIAALPDGCRLILLGDTDQLSSVEPGAVFGDLCAAGSGSPLAPCIVRLTRSHRFAVDQGIGLLAAAVVRGDAEAALATLDEPGEDRTERQPLASAAAFDRFAMACADDGTDTSRPCARRHRQPRPPSPCVASCAPIGTGRSASTVSTESSSAAARPRRVGERRILRRQTDYRDAQRPPDRPLQRRHGRRGGQRRGTPPSLVPGPCGRRRAVLVTGSAARARELLPLTVHRAQGSEYDESCSFPATRSRAYAPGSCSTRR